MMNAYQSGLLASIPINIEELEISAITCLKIGRQSMCSNSNIKHYKGFTLNLP